jgi:hypothetical protein
LTVTGGQCQAGTVLCHVGCHYRYLTLINTLCNIFIDTSWNPLPISAPAQQPTQHAAHGLSRNCDKGGLHE